MEENFKEAFYEIDEIIKLLPKELVEKIPNDFIKVIRENKSTSYKRENIKLENIKELKKETRVILYHIYRDFFALPDETKKLKNEEFEMLEEKYSYEKLFSKQKENDTDNSKQAKIQSEEITNLVKIEKTKWYIKFLNFLKSKLK